MSVLLVFQLTAVLFVTTTLVSSDINAVAVKSLVNPFVVVSSGGITCRLVMITSVTSKIVRADNSVPSGVIPTAFTVTVSTSIILVARPAALVGLLLVQLINSELTHNSIAVAVNGLLKPASTVSVVGLMLTSQSLQRLCRLPCL